MGDSDDVQAALSLKPRQRKKDHAASGKSDAELRMNAVEIAADMESGYYTDSKGTQWEPRPFVIQEVLKASGYEGAHIVAGWRPTWWPGTDVLRRMVSLKLLLRQSQRTATDGQTPWLDAALATSAEEILRRLYLQPKEIAMRELVDLTTKLARMRIERPTSEKTKLPPGTVMFEEIRRTIMELPESERARASRDFDRAIEAAKSQVPAIPATVPS